MPDTGPNYSLPPGYFVQSGDTILPSQHNPIFEDVAAAMNARMMRNGTAPMTGNLQMGSKNITGLAAATQAHHAPRWDQVQPKNAWLTSVSALSLAANEMVYASGTNTAAKTTLTAFARTLLDDANAAAARTTLGLSALATDSVAPVSRGGTGATTASGALSNLGGVPTGRSISAGNGLSGGGSLGGNISLSLGTPSSITGSSTNSVSSTSHTHLLDLGSLGRRSGAASDDLPRLIYINGDDNNTISRVADTELRAAFNLAAGDRNIAAGNGLTGGGNLTANRTIALGTPSAITATSTNSVSGTSHTHELHSSAVRELISVGGVGQVGTYAFLKSSTTQEPGGTTAGSSLEYAAASGATQTAGASPSGTWRCMGYCPSGQSTLWLRIS